MLTNYKLFRESSNDHVEDEYVARLRTLYTGVAAMLGIKSIGLERLSANDITRAVVKDVEFHDGATDGIKIYAQMMLPFIGEAFSTIGVAKMSMEFNDDDKKMYENLWTATTEKAIDKRAADDALEYARRVAASPDKLISVDAPTSSDKPEVEEEQDSEGPIVVNYNDDRKSFYIYEQIAELLPVEGRDYDLNPSENDKGGIHLEPVAYTKIGKIWLEYLREVLPEYSIANDAEKDAILHRPWNYGEQK